MNSKKTSLIWIALLLLNGIIIFFLFFDIKTFYVPHSFLLIILFFASAFCEYIDSSLGMGYGTTFTPFVLTLGLARVEIVPIVLLAELFSGLFAGLKHHQEGNVDLLRNKQIKFALICLIIPSIIGVVSAILFSNYLKIIDQKYVNLYIAIMVMMIGLYIIYRFYFKNNRKTSFNHSKLLLLGVVAAFNKGVSGGGYGPLLTSGQILSGISQKEAVAITSFCEAFTCLIGIIVFFTLGGTININYLVPICLGSLLSVVPAVKTIRLISDELLGRTIGWATLLLGSLTLLKFL